MDFVPNDNQSLAWQGYDLYLQTDSNIDDISYMFEETTPVKSCGDFAYHFDDGEILNKSSQESKEYSSQNKRRRLDFDNDEEISSLFLKSKCQEKIDAHFDISELDAYVQDLLPPTTEDFAESEAWLTECLNDTDFTFSSDDGNFSVSSDVEMNTSNVQNGQKEASASSSDCASSIHQRPVKSSRNIIFKGRKTYMSTPSKGPSVIVHPFSFIKPSTVKGDITLKDINQKILTPKSKPKASEEDVIYPISAISGKPVVGKTKIPTRGNGSITIMRTKG